MCYSPYLKMFEILLVYVCGLIMCKIVAMGGQNSQCANSSSKVSSEEWRKMQWSKEKDLHYINNYQPHKEDIQHLRILLHGPIGAGKSSFINSVNAVLQGRMTSQALANAASKESFTKAYRTFKIQKGKPKTFYPFAFTDIMGVDKDKNKGVGAKDMMLVMKGHVKDGYKFSTDCPISEEAPGYNNSPSLTDKVHVLVYVISASKSKTQSDNCIKKLWVVRHEASRLGIPQILLLTKIDEACPEVKADLRNVYKSSSLKEQMESMSVSLGIPLYCIFPVKNYHSEIHTDDSVDTLILSALRKMLDFGEEFVNSM